MAQVAAITETDVEAAVQALVAAGVHPSVRRVREQLGGRGSMTTITPLLGRVKAVMNIPALPAMAMARSAQMVVMPAPANQVGPSVRELELERELAELRGRMSMLEGQHADREARLRAEHAAEIATLKAGHATELAEARKATVSVTDKALAKLVVRLEEVADLAAGQTKALLREAPGYHRDLLHALRAVEIAGEWLREQFQPDAQPLKLIADIEDAPPVLTAAAAAKAKASSKAKAAPRARKA